LIKPAPRSKSGKAAAKLPQNVQQATAKQPQNNVQLDSFPMSFDYYEETWGLDAESMSMMNVKTVG
jgi:hypothetical protein